MSGLNEDDAINAEIDTLRRAFVDRLPMRIEALNDASAALGAADGEVARQHAIDDVGNVAHGISGSAGLFGFQDLADAAEELEAACETAQGEAANRLDLSGLVRSLREIASGVA
ncbi:MAG: hypothetical protein HOH04_09060 [Rhodospirillaceae bacterium]|jgi:HPt (histidine-containing phosphotransfer) domain-containing protein|nr:hypothetical protein [Rhodospirillaceae bacterium]